MSAVPHFQGPALPIDSQQKSAYEIKREERIAKNRRTLESLGLVEASADLKKCSKKKTVVPRVRQLYHKVRSSARIMASGTPSVALVGTKTFSASEDEPAKAMDKTVRLFPDADTFQEFLDGWLRSARRDGFLVDEDQKVTALQSLRR
jgi:hypothetical protein